MKNVLKFFLKSKDFLKTTCAPPISITHGEVPVDYCNCGKRAEDS